MITEILYKCEYCGRFKNTDKNIMEMHELYCPYNLRALHPITAIDTFDVKSFRVDNDHIVYRETISIDNWIKSGCVIDPYENELNVFLLNGKKILCCLFDKKDKIYPFSINDIRYTVQQLKSFGKIEVVVYSDYSD